MPFGRDKGIIRIFILLISLSVSLVGAATILASRGFLEDHALRGAREVSELVLGETDARLDDFFGELRALATGLAGTRAVLSADPEGMRDLFVPTVLARRRYLRAVYLGTARGAMHEWGVGAGFVDHVPTFPPGYDPRERPWYRTAIEAEGFATTAPYRYASVDDIGITCVLPVRRGDGSLVGVLGLDILLDDLGRLLDDLDLPKGGKASILGSGGEAIASQLSPRTAGAPPLQPLALPGLAAALEGGDGSFDAEIGGRPHLVTHRRRPGQGWTLLVAMPLDEVMAGPRQMLKLVSLVNLVLMILLALAIAFIAGRLIVAPLSHIVSVINRMEAGEKGVRAAVPRRDEFGVLAAELNKLADAVEDNSRDLEEKVRTRTEELERLQRENTQLRIVEERQRIYRDLHDGIGAKLTNVFFAGSVARALAAGGDPRLLEALEGVEANCTAALQGLRDLVRGMRGGAEGEDLLPFLERSLARRAAAGGMAYETEILDRAALERLDPEAARELVLALDELASNALRHSGGRLLRVSAGREGERLVLRMEDDGRGFEPAAGRPGSGLDNVRFRLGSQGGSATLETAPGAGCAWTLRLPLLPEAADSGGAERTAQEAAGAAGGRDAP